MTTNDHMRKQLTKTRTSRPLKRRVLALAKELWTVGAREYFRKTQQKREPIWEAVDPNAIAAWIVVARHILKSPNH
jgi:hypothetical protein